MPFDVITAILQNNRGIKRCFVPLIQSGNIPPRVDVRFDLMPTGQASNASIVQGSLSGTSFEQCMAGAVMAIQFPESSGSGQRITFPFVLQ